MTTTMILVVTLLLAEIAVVVMKPGKKEVEVVRSVYASTLLRSIMKVYEIALVTSFMTTSFLMLISLMYGASIESVGSIGHAMSPIIWGALILWGGTVLIAWVTEWIFKLSEAKHDADEDLGTDVPGA